MQRRRFLATAALATTPLTLAAAPAERLKRAIPSSGEPLPVIGMGSWITFNVGADLRLRETRLEVLRAFFAAGGGMIDSSPMYGSSEEVIGWCLQRLDHTDGLFAASKVWTPLAWHGLRQMEDSERLWGGRHMDLQQVHNLVGLASHLQTLAEWKAAGRIRYVGVTTSHGSRHEELEQALRDHPLDFVQLTYNLVDRAAEQRLLPLAAERGVAVIVNRPFRRGALVERLARHPLPSPTSARRRATRARSTRGARPRRGTRLLRTGRARRAHWSG